jgi:hypothetical protein
VAPAAHSVKAHFGSWLFVHWSMHFAPATHFTSLQSLPWQVTLHELAEAQLVAQKPSVHARSHVLPGPQWQALLRQVPLHDGLFAAHSTAQLPSAHAMSHWLPGPQ